MQTDNDFKTARKHMDFYDQKRKEMQQQVFAIKFDLECGKGNFSLCKPDTSPSYYNITVLSAKLHETELKMEEANNTVGIKGHTFISRKNLI